MEGNEYDIFSELEHEIGRDLTRWRRDIVASFGKCCLAAMKMEEATSDPLDLTDPAVRESIKRHTIDFLIDDWINHKDSPHPGDIISVTGESYWHTLDSSDGEMATFRLPMTYKIEGPLLHWDILPYIDEAGLEENVHRNSELTYRYTHPFGLHLITRPPDDHERCRYSIADLSRAGVCADTQRASEPEGLLGYLATGAMT